MLILACHPSQAGGSQPAILSERAVTCSTLSVAGRRLLNLVRAKYLLLNLV